MKSSYLDLKDSISAAKLPARIQKIYSSSHFLVFKMRAVGFTYYLYLGRGDIFNGLWYYPSPLPGPFRINDSLLDMFRKRMEGHWANQIILNPECKQLSVSYRAKDYHLHIIFRDKNLFFAFDHPAFFSWKRGGSFNFQELSEPINGKRSRQNTIADYLIKYGPRPDLKKQKFLLRKRDNIEKDLRKLDLTKIIKQLKSVDLTGKKDLQLGISFKLNPAFNHFQNLNLVYTKIKNLKKVIDLQKNRLQKLAQEIDQLSTTKIMPRYPIINPIKMSKTKFLTFRLNEKLLLLGRNQKENSEIRKIVNNNAWWFHLNKGSSPHLFVKTESDITPFEISIIASLIVSRTKSTFIEIELIMAKVKDIKGLPGGKVKYTNEKIVRATFNDNFHKYLID
jgi:hypothetical protein